MLNPNQLYILDGGFATELEKYGADLNDNLWSARVLLENPELIKRVNLDYLKSGADFVMTATYQATIEGLKQKGLTKPQSIQLLQESVKIALNARDEFWLNLPEKANRIKPIVTASIGPYGAFLADGSEYNGRYNLISSELWDFHYKRIKILLDAGAETLAFETIPNLTEAVVLANILREFPDKQAWISFSCKDETHIADGYSFKDAVLKMNNFSQVFAVGVNCLPPEWISSLLKSAKNITQKPFVVYPNDGSGWDAKSKCWIPVEKQISVPSLAQEWYNLGARIIGGCCRTSPKDIEEMRANLKIY